MGVHASDGSGWSSENDPYGGNDNSGKGTGPEGNGDGGNSGGGGNGSSMNFSKTPEKQAIASAMLMTIPSQIAIVEGTWGITINTTALTSPFARLAGLLESSLPMAGRLTAVGALLTPTPIALDTMDPAFREHQQQLANLVANQKLQSQTYSLTALPVSIVTDMPVKDISRQKTVPAKVVVEQVVSPEKNKVTPAMAKNPQQVNVVQAKKTGRPGVYSVEIAPGKPALQIEMTDKKPSASFKTPSYDNVKPESVIPSVTSETYQGIVDFGGDHAPIYISISKNPTTAQEKQLIEEANRDWRALYPAEAAELDWKQASSELSQADVDAQTAKRELDKTKSSPEGGALTDVSKNPLQIKQSSQVISSVFGIEYIEKIDNQKALSYLLNRNPEDYVINILSIASVYSAIPNPSEDNQDVRYVTSTLSGDKGITLASNGALTAQGSIIKSLDDITLSSGGNVRLESVKTNYRKQSGKNLKSYIVKLALKLTAVKR